MANQSYLLLTIYVIFNLDCENLVQSLKVNFTQVNLSLPSAIVKPFSETFIFSLSL